MQAETTLSPDQLLELHRKGYLGPFRLFSEEKANHYYDKIKHRVIEAEDPRDNANSITKLNFRHIDVDYIHRICTHDSIIGMMSDIYGPNLLLWESKIWRKKPGSTYIPWHQHFHHLPIDPQVSLTAWIALTPATKRNGCLEMIPGSHYGAIPQVPAPEDAKFDKMADPQEFDADESEPLEMAPGEFILFNEKTLHKSSRNRSDKPRVAVTSRVVPPYVTVHDEIFSSAEDDFTSVMLASGENTAELNELVPPPTE